MATLTAAHVRSLLDHPGPPCISLYMPAGNADQNTRLYGQLLAEVDRSLEAAGQAKAATHLTEKLRGLADDSDFWAHPDAGLAVLAAGDRFETHWLPRPVDGLVVVADSFHVKPLLRITQSADRFHVLAVSRTHARLFEGDRYRLAPSAVEVPSFDEAVGRELTQHQKGKMARGGRGPHTAGFYAGEENRKDELDVDVEKFFREVDRAVLDRASHPSGLPLVLVGLAANMAGFRKHTRNPHLLAEGVPHNPGAMSLPEIRDAAWEVIRPRYLDRLAKLKDAFEVAFARLHGSNDPAEVARAARDGRVGTLLVDADKIVPGRFDPATGEVTLADGQAAGVDDILDDIAELVLKTGGEVVVVPTDSMPSGTGVAAVFRY